METLSLVGGVCCYAPVCIGLLALGWNQFKRGKISKTIFRIFCACLLLPILLALVSELYYILVTEPQIIKDGGAGI